MKIATTEYWHWVDGVAELAFLGEVFAPVQDTEIHADAWTCTVRLKYGEQDRLVPSFGAGSFQALTTAVGFLVSEERWFLLNHKGPLGLSKDDISDDDGEFARLYADMLLRFDPSRNNPDCERETQPPPTE